MLFLSLITISDNAHYFYFLVIELPDRSLGDLFRNKDSVKVINGLDLQQRNVDGL